MKLTVIAGYAAAWRKRTTHLHEPDDLAEITCELFRFGAEQDALYDAITCDRDRCAPPLPRSS